MGNALSCNSAGSLLVAAAANNDISTAQRIIHKYPRSVTYHSYRDRSSPLLQAAAKGHFEMVQLILESAVMSEGLSRAKRYCLDHVNVKRQSALMVACKHGHPECVEYLASNGADPLIMDERRQNTCLHLAALYGHSDCVHKLLGARSGCTEQGRQLLVAQVPCHDTATGATVKFINSRNGWGLTALHIAVFQGAMNTVRTLLRHGAALDAVITAPSVESSPIRCAAGSNVLHIAAMVGSVGIVKLVLEAQEAIPGLDLRTALDSAGMKPQQYALRARSPVLAHLLDERLPVHLLRQVWLNYTLDAGMPARHQTLGSLLQKLKLMFNLEVIAAQRSISMADSMLLVSATTTNLDNHALDTAGDITSASIVSTISTRAGGRHRDRHATSPGAVLSALQIQQVNTIKTCWQQRLDEIQSLLVTVTHLHDSLQKLLEVKPDAVLTSARASTATAAAVRDDASVASPADGLDPAAELTSAGDNVIDAVAPSNAGSVTVPNRAALRGAPNEAILDFMLSMLITPRTVSAVLHAAKKLVTGSAMMAAGNEGRERKKDKEGLLTVGQLSAPKTSSEAQHSLGLLLTALKAVETCLNAAAHLANATPEELQQQQLFLGTGMQPAQQTPHAGSHVEVDGHAGSFSVASHGHTIAVSHASPGGGADTPATNISTRAIGRGDHGDAISQGGDLHSHLPDDQQSLGARTATPPPMLNYAAARLGVEVSAGSQASMQGSVTTAADRTVGMGIDDTGPLTAIPPAGTLQAVLPGNHWGAHLHTLLAQLQWDIGIQRHRRRRQHAAAAAARQAAQGSRRGSTGGPNATTISNADTIRDDLTALMTETMGVYGVQPVDNTHTIPTIPTIVPPQVPANVTQAASEAGSDHPRANAAGNNAATALHMLHRVMSRRGDAPQDVLTAGELQAMTPGGNSPNVNTEAGSLFRATPTTPAGDGGGNNNWAVPAVVTSPVGEEVQAAVTSLAEAHDSHVPATSGTPSAWQLNTPAATRALPSAQKKGKSGTKGGANDTHDWQGGEALVDSESGDDSMSDSSDQGVCAICMEYPMAVVVSPCQHGLCVQCALQLTVKGREAPCCPFCRRNIVAFDHRVSASGNAGRPGR